MPTDGRARRGAGGRTQSFFQALPKRAAEKRADVKKEVGSKGCSLLCLFVCLKFKKLFYPIEGNKIDDAEREEASPRLVSLSRQGRVGAHVQMAEGTV